MKKSKIKQLENDYSKLEQTNFSLLAIILPIGIIIFAGNDYLFRTSQSLALYYFPKYTVLSVLLAISGLALLIVSFINTTRAFSFESTIINRKIAYPLSVQLL